MSREWVDDAKPRPKDKRWVMRCDQQMHDVPCDVCQRDETIAKLIAERDEARAQVQRVRELADLNPGAQWSRSVRRALDGES